MDAAGYRIGEALFNAVGTPAKFSPMTIDGTAKTLIADLVAGTPAFGGRPDYENATFVLMIGTNPAVSHGHNIGMHSPNAKLKELAARGQLWVIDPRLSETAKFGGRHIAPRPGTDYAILGYLVRELLRDGANADYIANRTQDVNKLAEAVEVFTLGRVAALADVAPRALVELLSAIREELAGGRPIAVETGTGVTMSLTANIAQWFAWSLSIITASMNVEGGTWFHPGFGIPIDMFELPVSPPEGSFGPGPSSRPELRSFIGEWPCAVLVDEIEAGNIRAVVNLGGHLVTAFPDTERLVPALEKLEVFATLEIIANETSALSTHVLPTKDQMERSDVTLWDFLSQRVAAQHTFPVVEPVGDRRSAWWMLAELGHRLGYEIADPSLEDEAMLAGIEAYARRPYAEIVEDGISEVDRELPSAWIERHLDRVGGWRLAPQLLIDHLQHVLASASADPGALVFTPRRQRNHLNSQLDYLGDTVEVHVHPDDAGAAGVVHGAPVTVSNARGAITGTALVDEAVRRGTVSIPHGHQYANVNRLTDKDDVDPITGMAHYSGVAVRIGVPSGT
jgi:anaerobic selenocysteine-containing dehydrogenase